MKPSLPRLRGDDGSSMVVVLGISFVLMALGLLAGANAITALKDSRSHTVFAQNLDVAEAGVSQLSARLQKTNGTYSYCPTSVTRPVCDVPADVALNGFDSAAAEKAWAESTLLAIAAEDQARLTKTPNGSYLAIRPPSLNTIYSMAWIPSYAAPERQRLLKSEYIFSTYQPANAILTNGNIDCCPSYEVGLGTGVPLTTPFGIHSNGNLGGIPGQATSGMTVQASASGACSSPCTAGAPPQTVPEINPRAVYETEAAKYSNAWYDLCVISGSTSIRKPDLTPPVEPCTGAVIQTTLPFRGWTRSGTTWDHSGGDQPGVYYVYRGNIDLDNVTLTGGMTMITESTRNLECSKTDGWQRYKKVDWLSGGYIPGFMIMSGNYWYQNTQSHMGTGAIVAQEYVEQQTSSAPGVTGLLIAQNLCGGTNRLQGSVLYYNGGADLPIGSLIRSTLELEIV